MAELKPRVHIGGRMIHPSAFMGDAADADPLYQHVTRYLPKSGTAVDLGCGRGRWLDFAARAGLRTVGVDTHAGSVNECMDRGHSARVMSVDEYLGSRQKSVEVVSAFHLIEHLEPPAAMRLVSGMVGHLAAGGVAVVVTPNFGDWSVASESFWLDPTHIRPYPLPVIARMFEEAGARPIQLKTGRWIRTGPRTRVRIGLGKLTHGRQFGRLNALLVARREL